MSTDATLLQLALELAYEWDPTLDTAAGSKFRLEFLDPLLGRVGGSPLDVDMESFLVERLDTEIPDVDTSTYSAMRDLVIRAFTVMADPLRREISGVKTAQSLNNYGTMTRNEVDSLLGNYFTSLKSGARSTGTVRMYFSSPQTVLVSTATRFTTGTDLAFFPSTLQSISATQMSFQQTGSLYYFDILLEAENTGDSYNVDIGSINSVDGVSAVTKVTNLAKFTAGYADETKAEGIARTKNSITIRNLITARGAAFVIPESYPSIAAIQVIGRGDLEMQRDIIEGPVSISSIPGGFASTEDPDVGDTGVHIGGMTDIYLQQASPDSEDMDIENITDKGYRVYAGSTGYTDVGAGTTPWMHDKLGFFSKRGIKAGDYLIISDGFTAQPVREIIDISTVIGSDSVDSLQVTPVLDQSLVSISYEIVRRESGEVIVPLYDLVAMSNGIPLIGEDGEPVMPIPGSPTNAPLQDASGSYITKTENVSSENIQLPLLRLLAVQFLDPITLEETGDVVPMRGALAARVSGTALGYTGTIRVYFKDAVNCWVVGDSDLYAQTTFTTPAGYTYAPLSPVLGHTLGTNAAIPDPSIREVGISGDFTADIYVGDRIEFNANALFTILETAYDGVNTILTVREDLTAYTGLTAYTHPWRIHTGILESNMSKDPETGLYYLDIPITCINTDEDGGELAVPTLPIGTSEFTINRVNSEGWSLLSTELATSFSTRDLPYLSLTSWVNDTTDIVDDASFQAPALRLSYEYASELPAIQTFAEEDANRIVAEDILIRHFLQAYVFMSAQVRGLTASTSETALISMVNALEPTSDLEISDVANHLYTSGATYVQMPLVAVILRQDAVREWTAIISEDTVSYSRTNHFYSDGSSITTTEVP